MQAINVDVLRWVLAVVGAQPDDIALVGDDVIQFVLLEEALDGRIVLSLPVVQTQDLTVINITKEAVISRQAKVVDQLPPIAGQQRTGFKPVQIPPPGWWAEALIPLD